MVPEANRQTSSDRHWKRFAGTPLKLPDQFNAAFNLFGTLLACIERWPSWRTNLPGSWIGSTRVDELLVKDSLFTFQDTRRSPTSAVSVFLLWGGIHAGFNTRTKTLSLAEQNRRESGLTNVELLKGEMESIPLPDNSVDVIISNCVNNLSGDKDLVVTWENKMQALWPFGLITVFRANK
jgi:hypothetical protein